MAKRPNILCIMSDEHDPAVLGCHGDELVRTPALDSLARRGVVFENCYCNSPLCVPSRLSFTAGKYINRIDAWNNSSKLPADIPSLPRVLRQAGYTPYLCGKQHYDRKRRYGFADLIPEFNNNVKNPDLQRRDPNNTSIGHAGWKNRSAEFHPGDHGGILDHDRTVTDRATSFLRQHADDDEPWFLFAGYLAPHFPLIVPEHIYEYYKGKTPLPTIPSGLLANLPRNYQHQRMGFGTVDLGDDITQYGRDLYWALTDWFDREIGTLLHTLDACGLTRDTIVIYTSDHGENKGDHGMWWKNCCYEHGAGVPLIVSWPARWAGGQRRTGACSLVDLVQTIAELADGKTPDDWDGDSLVPWLDDPDHSWKDRAISQYYGHHVCSGISMLRLGDWKYVHHARADADHASEVELFNLREDPQELTNRASDPDQSERLRAMHASMVTELGEEPDDTEARYRATGGKGLPGACED